ncbi:hypothetical protein SFUMM280S_03240 [Streptomyces fumanus]
MAPGTVTATHELRFDTGRLCLDLLATTHPTEQLDSVEVLRAWITGAGLVPPGTSLAHADAGWPAAFRELRAQTARLVRDRLAPGTRAYALALARVNDTARTAPPAPRAVPGAGAGPGTGADRPPGVRRAARRGRPGRGGAAHRPRRPRGPAPVRGRQLPHRLPGHLPGAPPPLVLPARSAATANASPATAAARPSPAPRSCPQSPSCPATPGTLPRRGHPHSPAPDTAPSTPSTRDCGPGTPPAFGRGEPPEHAPDAAGPALRADEGTLRTRPGARTRSPKPPPPR